MNNLRSEPNENIHLENISVCVDSSPWSRPTYIGLCDLTEKVMNLKVIRVHFAARPIADSVHLGSSNCIALWSRELKTKS
jgi:hypothetical protein